MKKFLSFTNGNKIELANIYAIASNYSKHAKEMGTTIPDEPVIFLKPSSAYIPNGGTILLPKISNEVHHEVELVVVIGKDGCNITMEEAYKYIAGYAVGIDVTLRDIQRKAKTDGKPWGIAKGFYTSAPISDVVPADTFGNEIPNFDLLLTVDGELRQKANTSSMERSVAELVSFISKIFTLNEGDCIFTGTPDGVGKIVPGNQIYAELTGYVSLTCYVENNLWR